MKVNANASHLYTSQSPQATTAGGKIATSFTAALNASQAESTRRVDFASMTRQEMRDWVNGQIRSGEMSLDDGRPFMAMTMKIQAGVSSSGELPAATDGTRYDFTRKVREGITEALSRNDEAALKMLESAMSIMQRSQNQTIGVNIRV